METFIRQSECFREIHLHNINCVSLVKPSENRFFRQIYGLLLWIDEKEVMLPGWQWREWDKWDNKFSMRKNSNERVSRATLHSQLEYEGLPFVFTEET